MAEIKDIHGRKFGKLTVIRFEEIKDRKARWLCKCDCGNEKVIASAYLLNGNTKTCGAPIHRMKHGMCGTRIHRIWTNMKNRCDSESANHYDRYGGRGITYCDDWKEFEPFYKWAMKNGYTDKLSLDRIDNDGMYSPDNCRWTTHNEQMKNTKRNIYVEINGVTKTLTDWARHIGINEKTMSNRYVQGDRGSRLIRPLEKKFSPHIEVRQEFYNEIKGG